MKIFLVIITAYFLRWLLRVAKTMPASVPIKLMGLISQKKRGKLMAEKAMHCMNAAPFEKGNWNHRAIRM
jgi:hypothetical protein